MAHVPVMLNEVIEALQIKSDGIYLDGTFGRGGHAEVILSHLGPEGRLLACDRDAQAIAHGRDHPSFQGEKCLFFHSAFASMSQHIEALGLMGKIDGILLDLGVSSPQLDQAVRGFSFSQNGPLDMRMDQSRGESAAEWLASASEQTIASVLRRLGEERFSGRIARAIVAQNQSNPLTTTQDLVNLITRACPFKDKHKHPATRSFQAIRMHINDELGQLEKFLDSVPELLSPNGRLAIMSFHSGEDRIVKQWMRLQTQAPQHPHKLPLKANNIMPDMHLITRKPQVANQDEICHNPRSRSAKLRVIEKAIAKQ